MNIQTLTIRNFRNHTLKTFDFEKGINILSGPNAAGKTNVVEAINYLSLGKSFRINEDENVIQKGKDQSFIQAKIVEGQIKRKIDIAINKSGKQVLINDKPIKRLSELAKCVNVILFEPKDVLLFRGAPKTRRNFLDISISKKTDIYLDYLTRYEKVLHERNEILKCDVIDQNLLDANLEMLIKLSGPIINYRQLYVKDINDILYNITRALTHGDFKLEVRYYPFVTYDNEFPKRALDAFKNVETSDIQKKVTSIGIHREDFKMLLNGKDIAEFGSQGENRIAALALKLAPYFLIEDEDKKPIVVLDDVLSELDSNNQENLLKFIKDFEQVFITTTHIEVKGASYYPIKKNIKQEVF